VLAAKTAAERGKLINELLAHLQTSHTAFLTPDEPRYYYLLGVFGAHLRDTPLMAQFPDRVARYDGIGVIYEEIDGQTFIRAVWPGFPADKAGLRAGDLILTADGVPFAPIASFRGKAGQDVELRVQSRPAPESARAVTVVPRAIEPAAAFLAAQCRTTLHIRNGVSIAYMHIWSYAGQQYQDAFEAALATDAFRNADALVLDLREGLGGADPKYLNVFAPAIPTMCSTGRDGATHCTEPPGWHKPAALLVNEHSASGKEIYAYGFQKWGVGPVVGTRTAKAVVGGSPFALPGNNLLYLAVMDVTVDGHRIEGNGVTPDVVVPFELPFAEGKDPQLDRALELMEETVNRGGQKKAD